MKTQAGRWQYTVQILLVILALAIPLVAQDGNRSGQAQELTRVQDAARPAASPQFAPGQSVSLEGTIVKRDAEGITLQTHLGSLVTVSLSSAPEVREKKSNPFRRAHNYGITQLVPGLEIEVKGHGNNMGSVVADEIRFTEDNLRIASLLETRVTPVENRLSENEQNALRLSGQVSELSAVSNAARGGAKAAQETADSALDSAKRANTSAEKANTSAENAREGVHAANERITSLDDFDTTKSLAVTFKAGSSVLSAEAKQSLDGFAEQAKSVKGFLIEVAGFASAEGSPDYNRTLSQRRADAVIRYLAEDHSIPLRRFITPFGFGSLQPLADNKTRAGRMQNRRVEVHILVNKGLSQVAGTTASAR
jgi:outer membrane protein OmpA-like peptidoglycan-associated protein